MSRHLTDEIGQFTLEKAISCKVKGQDPWTECDALSGGNPDQRKDKQVWRK